MLANKHQDYNNEKGYLERTYGCINDEISYLENEINIFLENLTSLKKSSGGNYSDKLQVESNLYELNTKKLEELKKAQDKPYFGRIDFKQMGKDDVETFYIGKTGLEKRDTQERLMVDWRAPIASLYYGGELGDVMYTAPEGLMMGDLVLKRQYEIEDKILINIFDKGLTPMDEFLQNALWQKKDNKLKDIVSTIQGEQNDIIRGEKDQVLIVQGVAGSGKTTIILHRVAYLLYNYKDILKPDKILIVVPNKLFLNYISDVLPDLGVNDIKQFTFTDLALTLLNENYKIIDMEKSFSTLLDNGVNSKDSKKKINFVSSFKGSLYIKDIIDNIVNHITDTIVPKLNFNIDGHTIYSYDEIKYMFEKDYSYLPIVPRIDQIKRYIKGNLKNRLKEIKDEINDKYYLKISNLKDSISCEETLQKKLIKIYDERDLMIKNLDKKKNPSFKKYFSQWDQPDIESLYKALITNPSILKKYSYNKLNESDINIITDYSKEIIRNNSFEKEDLSPLLYLKSKLIGLDMKGHFSHIVVDEAQDHSPFEMYILNLLSLNSSFTIVGDLSQGIYSHSGIESWSDLKDHVFNKQNIEYLTIKKCYRSTMEIISFANEVIKKSSNKDITLAEPVLRTGEKPFIINKKEETNLIDDIKNRLVKLKNKGYESIAIICKTEKDSIKLYNKLKDRDLNLQLITDNDTVYQGKITIIPSYLSKGLEFDTVIIYDCSHGIYNKNELDIKLLYVCITRAMHELYIYYKNKSSILIEDIAGDKFNNV
ncbi:RNA polymerase recycling motor HelD [Dethiothermospora halolimnae]|uniref:RNA polymerase recycling motor HelD n=1 Tax=Dethiothermospora halolimnae TaxID=3114390 RepID=UPI003CCBB476